MTLQKSRILTLKERILERYNELNKNAVMDATRPIIIASEWIGRGIRRGVAVQEMKLAFVMLSIRINGTFQWDQHYSNIEDPTARIYNISRGSHYRAQIDLDNIENTTINLEVITDAIDAECPFARSFQLPTGAGEGWFGGLTPDRMAPSSG